MAPTRRDTIKAAGTVSALAVLGGTATAQEDTDDDDSTDGAPDDGEAQLRVGHFVSGAPAVDVRLVPSEDATDDGGSAEDDGDAEDDSSEQMVAEALSYSEVGEYATVDTGAYMLQILASEGESVIYEQEVTLEATFYTAAAVGQEDSVEVLLLDDYDVAQVRLVHAAPDAPSVDVTVADANLNLFDDVSYGETTGYMAVPPGQYTLEVRPDSPLNNADAVGTFDVEIESGMAYSAYATGLLDSEEGLQLVASSDGPMSRDEGADDEGSEDDEETPEEETPDDEDTPEDGTPSGEEMPDGEGTPDGDTGNETSGDDELSITPNF